MKLTHRGMLTGCDSRTGPGDSRTLLFRETKNFWVDQYGAKYTKVDGRAVGSAFPLWKLEVTSLIPLDKTN